MGDYLNHVAARVSGIRGAVRPRVPSLFEPPRTLVAARVSSIFAAHRAEREPPPPPMEEASTGSAAPASNLQLPVVREKRIAAGPAIVSEPAGARDSQPPAPESAPERKPALRTTRALGPVVSEERSDSQEGGDGGTQPVRGAVPSAAPAASEEVSRLQLSRERNRPVVQHADSAAADRNALSPAPPRRVEAEKEKSLLPEARAVERPSLPILPRVTTSVNTPAVNPVQVARQTPPIARPEAVEDASPTVQVVIGRVTVQAIAPPVSPAPAPKPQLPRLSLEEYLKQREAQV